MLTFADTGQRNIVQSRMMYNQSMLRLNNKNILLLRLNSKSQKLVSRNKSVTNLLMRLNL